MPLRFRGLVKAARDLENRMFTGLDPVETRAFLGSVGRIVVRVERWCLERGAGLADFPRPSRCAFARILALARLAPHDLVPIQGVSRRLGFRIANVVSNLDRFLRAVQPAMGEEARSERLERTLDEIRRSVERIERLCRKVDVSPGRLPEPSAYAFAMMKWLAGWDVESLLPGPDRLGNYVTQLDMARGPLGSASAAVWGADPDRVDVAFVPGHHVWRARHRGGTTVWRLSPGWLAAESAEFEDLAAIASRRRRRPPRTVLERHRAFTESSRFRAVDRELEAILAGDQYEPRGRFRDLDALFVRMNAAHFDGGLGRPRLHWAARAARGRFGSYDRVRDVVCMNPVLDDPRVPEWVTAYVLYHELLHKSHGFRLAGTRRMAHTREFTADERRFPGWEEASRWLELLANDWDGPPPAVARRDSA